MSEYTGLKVETQEDIGIAMTTAGPASLSQGVVLHYPGAPVLQMGGHAEVCHKQVREWDRQHRNKSWNGIGYHGMLCQHGILMLGRGLRRQGAHAPGANSTHFGLLIMVANDQDMTPAQLLGFLDVLRWLKSNGVNSDNITPHSHWVSTSCPGDRIRTRIRTNNWTGGVAAPPSSGGGSSSGGGMTSVRSVKYQQEAVNAAGYSPALVVDNLWGPKTDAGVKWLQKKLGVEADGLWGKATDAAHQKTQKGGDVSKPPAPKKKIAEDGILGKQTISELQRALNEGRF